ncbi:MAG: hypothetical protein ACI4Q3_07010 [Kiritimatiellia bacterium]
MPEHTWTFFRSARCVQVKIETGADLKALATLDRKLWTVLSAPAAGLRFDAATLKLLDSDADGRIRVPEVLAAVAWMARRFTSLDFLFARKGEIALELLDEGTEEGRALKDSFAQIRARAGRQTGPVTLADVTSTTAIFNGQPFNGDGVVTPKSTVSADEADLLATIVATEGAVTDRSGAAGVDQTTADAFFADAAAYLAWKAGAAAAATLGDRTAAAWAAYQAVEAAIDEYFTPPPDLPLVAEDPTPTLPLTAGLNPLWLARFRAFAADAAAPALGRDAVDTLTRDEWAAVKAKLAPYGAWLAAKAGAAVAGVGDGRLAALVGDGGRQRAVNALIRKDLALADEYGRLVDCERALRYAEHLVDWICNYVNQANLYDLTRDSVYRTGVLYIDGRACRLCFHVEDEGPHAALAQRSKCCLVYAKLSRRAAEGAREICAVVTAGTTASLYAGRNGLFVDCDGNDWDAVVSKVVEAQVSLREAFWAPWAKIAATISEQCRKFLVAKQDAAVAGTAGGAAAAVAAPPASGAALASGVAALGVGVGMAGAACAGLIGLVAGLPFWKVLAGVAALVLFVSLPSVVLAWFKLRARDLGAILNAGGWAVNRPLHFSARLAKSFTVPARVPASAAVARDPGARGGWLGALALVVVLAAVAAVLCCKLGLCPFAARPPCAAVPQTSAET